METDSFVLGVYNSITVKDLQNLDDLFDLRKLNENHEFFSDKKENNSGKLQREIPKNVLTVEYICLGSIAYSFIRASDKTQKSKVISESQSKNIKFEEN